MDDLRFQIGSKAFFSNMEGFRPHDDDTLFIQETPADYKNTRYIHLYNNCYIYWRKCDKNFMIDYALHKGIPMQVGKFLVPDFAKYIGLTIEDLKRLEPLIKNLDNKHKYEEVIFKAYIENNDFYLTDEQRKQAYKQYKDERK